MAELYNKIDSKIEKDLPNESILAQSNLEIGVQNQSDVLFSDEKIGTGDIDLNLVSQCLMAMQSSNKMLTQMRIEFKEASKKHDVEMQKVLKKLKQVESKNEELLKSCLLYTSPSPRDA